jgi:16S rRNA (cytosine1402-N4)-methyltransferase
MEYAHRPVLLAEVSQHIPTTERTIVVDCTLGGAGHAQAILERIAPDGMLVGIDTDTEALAAARASTASFRQQTLFIRGNFRDLDRLLTEHHLPAVDAFLFDLGVSSHQLDEPSRGFSYQHEAPLDMRMSGQGATAADLVNEATEERLETIIRRYGEERFAKRIARAITSVRPVRTTTELAEIVKEAIPAATRRTGPHPARRTFQALRIATNDELEALEEGLQAAIGWLAPGGRLMVISYHSLEDRIAKSVMREGEEGCTCPPGLAVCVCGRKPLLKVLTKRPIVPSASEIEDNPRARSARLRIAEKVG